MAAGAAQEQQQLLAAQGDTPEAVAAAADWRAGAAGAPRLWKHFVVCGLRGGEPLQTMAGERGFLGAEQRYKAHFVDSLPHGGGGGGGAPAGKRQQERQRRLPPPQLPTCCLPAGVDVLLQQDLAAADQSPHTFSFVLTEGDGTKVYASCLTFYDRVPDELCARHEDLLGARALKALCLLSRQPSPPYLAASDKVLRELYRMAFVDGSDLPLPEAVSWLLSTPCPQPSGPKLLLCLGRTELLLRPPLPVGPPPGELSLRPLVEALRPDHLVGLFVAVLLEQRVLLRSRQPWLLTAVAEGVVRLLHPLMFHHVYIPVMPYGLADYLEAPTPFLMGLHSGEAVDARVLEGLVVVDLDAGTLSPGRDGELLRRCLEHPYARRLRDRVGVLLRPATTGFDVLCEPRGGDPWVAAARAQAMAPWGARKQALLVRVFLEFFREALDGHELLIEQRQQQQQREGSSGGGGGGTAGGSLAGRSSGGSSTCGSPPPPPPPMQQQQQQQQQRQCLQRHQQQQGQRPNLQALLDHHERLCGPSDPCLLQQLLQGLPFLSFAAERGGGSGVVQPPGWLAEAERALSAWREGEEEAEAADAAGGALGGTTSSKGGGNGCDGTPGDIYILPQPPAGTLAPSGGLRYASFPALVLADAPAAAGSGTRVRRRSISATKKRASVGRRRAISELMGSPVDLRHRSPLHASLDTGALGPRLLRGANGAGARTALPLSSGLPRAGNGAVGGAGGLSASATSATSAASAASAATAAAGACAAASLAQEYTAEAELVRRQTALLVQLMQSAAPPGLQEASAGAGEGGGGGDACALSDDDLEAARLLLTVQTGGNGWFLVSWLREVLASGGADGQAAGSRLSSRSSSSSRGLPPAPQAPAMAAAAADTGPAPHISCAGAVPAAPAGSSRAGLRWLPPMAPLAKPLAAKTGKLFGVSIGGGSASGVVAGGTGKLPVPPGTKVGQGVDALAATAALAVVAMLNRTAMSSRARQGPSPLPPPPLQDSSARGSSVPSEQSSRAPSPQHMKTEGGDGSPEAAARGRQGDSSADGSGGSGGSGGSVASGSASSGSGSSNGSGNGSGSDDSSDNSSGSGSGSSSSSGSGSSSSSGSGSGSSSSGSSGGGGSGSGGGSRCGGSGSSSIPAETAVPCPSAAPSAPSGPGAGPQPDRASTSVPGSPATTHYGGCWREHCVSGRAFGVLADTLNAIVEVAAVQDEFRVVLAALQLAGGITCQPPLGPKRRLLAELARNPVVHAEWFWAGAFTFAVSSCCLTVEELPSIRDAVVTCLSDFVQYLAGLGITGVASWLLLMQLASEHAVLHTAIEPDALLALRVHLARHDALAEQAKAQLREAPLVSAGGAAGGGGGGNVRAQQMRPAAQLPDYVAAGLRACGIAPGDGWPTGAPGAAAGDITGHGGSGGGGGSSSSSSLPCGAAGWGDGDVSADCHAATEEQQRPALPVWLPAAAVAAAAAAAAADPAPPTLPSGGTSPRQVGAAGPSRGGSPSCTDCTSPPLSSRLSPVSSCRLSPRTAGLRLGQHDRPGLGYSSARSSYQQHRQRHQQEGALLTASTAVPAPPEGQAASPTSPSPASLSPAQAASPAAAGPLVQERAPPWSSHPEGGSLLQPGVLQWAAVHTCPVASVDCSNHVLASVGLDGGVKVFCGNGEGRMRLATSVCIPGPAAARAGGAGGAPGELPLLRLWQDGQRVAVANARPQAVWVLDLAGAAPGVELSGLGAGVSALCLLRRNREALLAGLDTAGASCCSRGADAAAYLWDLRRPRRPAASLDFSAAAVQPGPGGTLCLAVHGEGVLAAAGCRDGRAVVWDMRQPAVPLAECVGHQGPVSSLAFAPAREPALSAAGQGRAPLLVSGGDDWTARVWDAACGACRAVCVGHGGAVTAVQVVVAAAGGGDGGASRLVTGAADGSVGVWGLGGELRSLEQRHGAPVRLLAQGTGAIISGAADLTCHAWSRADTLSCGPHEPRRRQLRPVASQARGGAPASSLAFDAVAGLVAGGHRDGAVSVWSCGAEGAGAGGDAEG